MKKRFDGHRLFDGRTIVIATMHKKEQVIAPILEKELDMKCVTSANLNTDKFGTFSGEIARDKPPLQTVRLKALAALDLFDESLVIASEGSFGSHPSSPFIAANEEFVMLIDTLHQFEIIGRHFTVKTNFSHRNIKSLKDLEGFKNDIGYPEHGLILKIKEDNRSTTVHKDFGISNELELQVIETLHKGLTITAESDMRAMNNPTRMFAIEQAVLDLIKNIKSLCPECRAPGFVIQEVIAGLPCEWCHLPTKSAKAYVYKCQKCNYFEERSNAHKSFEEPTYCDFCNP